MSDIIDPDPRVRRGRVTGATRSRAGESAVICFGAAVLNRPESSSAMADRLLDVFSRCLDIPAGDLDDDISPSNTSAWDSLAAMELVTAIEDDFDVRLKTSEIMKMRSIGLARSVLRAKGVENI
jgi:acyl carrier protein